MDARKKYLLVFVVITLLLLNVQTRVLANIPEKQYVSRGEMAVMFSSTNFMKQQIEGLMNFAVGYNLFSLSRSTMAPIIRYVKVAPFMVPPDGRTLFKIYTSVDDPGGASQILGVNADISSVGRLSKMSLVDNGLWGDDKAGDGIYTLQTSPATKLIPGEKELTVSVANKKGWLSVAKATVVIENNPVIVQAEANPSTIRVDGKTSVLLTVKIENPGRIEDINNVQVDLTQLGGTGSVAMYNNGLHGDLKDSDNIFSLEIMPDNKISFGEKRLPVFVSNVAGGFANGVIVLNVAK